MTMRIACCQIAPDVGDASVSATEAGRAIAAAVAEGAEIVVLPELANSGYVFRSEAEVRAAATPADGEVLASWAAAAGRDAIVIAGFCELASDGTIHNSAAVIDGGGVLAVYRKVHLWAEEQRWFTPGNDRAPVLDTRHGRIGVAICYDLEFPELTRGLALAGAELIAVPTNWPYHPNPPDGRPILHSLASVTAYLNRVYVAVCDRCGSERGLEFEGGSAIAGADGALLAGPVKGRDVATIAADCDLRRARNKRSGTRNDAFADRRPGCYAAALVAEEVGR
jgi:predicted amidohydrolase